MAHQVPLLVGILQARILECVASPPLGDLPNPGIKLKSPALQVDSLPSEPPRKPKNTGVDTYFLSRGSSWPRNWTGVSCIAGGFFTSWATREAWLAAYISFLTFSFFSHSLLFLHTHTHIHTYTHTKQKPMKFKKKSNLLRPGAYILRTNKGNLQPVKSSRVSKFIH